jgi:DNA-binding NtrC family response regulator
MLDHDWPRNVREVDKFAAELAASLVQGSPMPPRPVRGRPLPPEASPPPSAPRRGPPAREQIEEALEENDFNQTRAAKALGVPYATLDRWMRDLGVVRPRDLGHEALSEVLLQCEGDLERAARVLRLSLRGLQGRMKELGL